MRPSAITPEDFARARNMIEMAAICLIDGAYHAALDRLRDATKIVEVLVTEREAMIAAIPVVVL